MSCAANQEIHLGRSQDAFDIISELVGDDDRVTVA